MDHIHARLDEPINLRKGILESAIFATEGLKAINDFVKFNNDNNLFMNHFKESVKQLKSEIDKLTNILPPLPDEFRKIELKPRRPFEIKQQKTTESLDQRTKFDKELEEIRAKMARLMMNR